MISSALLAQSQPLEGSVWRGISNSNDHQITFLPGGIFRDQYHNGVEVVSHEKGHWSITNNQIYMEVNDKFAECNGVISGDKIGGKCKNKKMLEWDFEYTKIDINTSPKFEAVARKYIRPQSSGNVAAVANTYQSGSINGTNAPAFENKLANRKIPLITSNYTNNTDEIFYTIPLQFYNPKLGNFREACQFEFNVAGKSSGAYQFKYPYEFGISVNSSVVDDMKIDWDSKESVGSVLLTKLITNLPVCIVSGDIYLSEIYASGWKQIEDKLNNVSSGSSQCLKFGMNFKQMPYYLSKQATEVKYPSIFHPIAKNVISECEKIVNREFKRNFECTVGDAKRSTKCDEGWYESRNGQFYKLSTYKELIEAKLGNRQVSVMGAETIQANAEYKALVAQQEAEKAKKVEEAEKYKKWLETPEGKKYLTEQRIAEEARAKQEQAQKIKAEKASILEKAEKEKMKQDCLKITAWSSDSRELIATALKVPMSSISLIRTQLGALDHCLAVIDTAKGLEKCRVMRIFQDRNTKEYAASFSDGIIPAYQAVCGPWAF